MATPRSAIPTGPQRVRETVIVRSRPSLRTGFSILLAGALIGGVIGITMRARQNAADATFAAEQLQAAQPPAPSAQLSPPQSPASVAQAQTAPAPVPPSPAELGAGSASAQASRVMAPTPPASASSALASSPAKEPPPAKDVKKHSGKGHASLAPKVSSAPKEPKEAKEPKESKDKSDGYRIASAEPGDSRESGKESKATKEPKESKDTKDSTAPVVKKSSKSPDDAVNVLKAAMGATENTL
jgi:hypothetical protein